MKAESSADRWGPVKQEIKLEPEDDEDEFYDAEEFPGSSWLTSDCPTLPEALKPYIHEVSTYMEDLVILEEDHSRPEAQRWAVYEVTPSFSHVFDGENYYNLDDQHNTQNANAFCKLNRSWYIDADPDEIKDDLDFRQIPPEVQALITQEVTEAAKVHHGQQNAKGQG